MKIVPFYDFYSTAVCRANPDAVFVFGDNLVRAGTGGQATIRHEKNAIGIATKKTPSVDSDAFFSDADLSVMQREIQRVHLILVDALRSGKTVFWPADGIGTGLSALPEKSPKCYDYLCRYSRALFEKKGTFPLFSAIVCGGRDFEEKDESEKALKAAILDAYPGHRIEIIEGGALGADRIAGRWAAENNLVKTTKMADWDRYKKRAGYIRNLEMAKCLAARRDQMGAKVHVFALPGADGTAMMKDIAGSRDFRFPVTDLCSHIPYTPKEKKNKGETFKAKAYDKGQSSFDL